MPAGPGTEARGNGVTEGATRNLAIRRIVATGLAWAASTASAFGQSKLDARIERTLSEIGIARVLVVMTAPKPGEASSAAYREPAVFVADLLGGRGRNVQRIADLPVVVVETDRRGIADLVDSPHVARVAADEPGSVSAIAALVSSARQGGAGAGESSPEDVDAASFARIAGARRIIIRAGAGAMTMRAGELAERISSALGSDATVRSLGAGIYLAESRTGFSVERLSGLMGALGSDTRLYLDEPVKPGAVR